MIDFCFSPIQKLDTRLVIISITGRLVAEAFSALPCPPEWPGNRDDIRVIMCG
jgi:hypothetical protein